MSAFDIVLLCLLVISIVIVAAAVCAARKKLRDLEGVRGVVRKCDFMDRDGRGELSRGENKADDTSAESINERGPGPNGERGKNECE